MFSLAIIAMRAITLDDMACTRETALKVISLIYEGKTLEGATKEAGISQQSFHELKESIPDISLAYACAQRAKAEMYAEGIIQIADTEPDPNRARVMVDARKWYASKMQPQKYGDRIDLNINATVDIQAALAAAKARVLPASYLDSHEDAQVIETKHALLNETNGPEPVEPKDADASAPIDLFS